MMSSMIFMERKEVGLPYMVRGIGVNVDQKRIIKPNGQPVCKWLCCIEGEGELIVSGTSYSILPGMGFLLREGLPHEYAPVKSPWKTQMITFYGSGVEELLNYFGFHKVEVFHLSNPELLHMELNNIFQIAKMVSAKTEYLLSQKLYAFLLNMDLVSHNYMKKSQSLSQMQVGKLIAYLEESYKEDIGIEEMAEYLHVSKQYLCRIFKKEMSMRPFEYLIELRIKKARQLLLEQENLTIGQIAEQVGFHSHSYFCFVFSKRTGMSPKQYRMSTQQKNKGER